METIKWSWTDSRGKSVDKSLVEYTKATGERSCLAIAQTEAVRTYDSLIGDFINKCNKERAIHWMRCRLVCFLGKADRYAEAQTPSAYDLTTFQTLKPMWMTLLTAHVDATLRSLVGHAPR